MVQFRTVIIVEEFSLKQGSQGSTQNFWFEEASLAPSQKTSCLIFVMTFLVSSSQMCLPSWSLNVPIRHTQFWFTKIFRR